MVSSQFNTFNLLAILVLILILVHLFCNTGNEMLQSDSLYRMKLISFAWFKLAFNWQILKILFICWKCLTVIVTRYCLFDIEVIYIQNCHMRLTCNCLIFIAANSIEGKWLKIRKINCHLWEEANRVGIFVKWLLGAWLRHSLERNFFILNFTSSKIIKTIYKMSDMLIKLRMLINTQRDVSHKGADVLNSSTLCWIFSIFKPSAILCFKGILWNRSGLL